MWYLWVVENGDLNMTNIIETMISEIKAVLADRDEKFKAEAREWGVARFNAVQDLWKRRKDFRSTEEFYQTLYSVAGGKTWYNTFQGQNATMVVEIMDKNSDAIITKRNTSIAKKLEKVGVTSVNGSEFNATKDGFHGVFSVETDAGTKKVNIDTIYAGGHNVQKLHTRTLVKVVK